MRRAKWVSLTGIVLVSSMVLLHAAVDSVDRPAMRTKAAQLQKDGNWKEAYDLFSKLAVDPADEALQVEHDLKNSIRCLQRLNRVNETDAFREKVIAAHAKNWRLLRAAAQTYMNGPFQGTMIAGEFKRGPHRGGRAKWVNSYERDRIRALQLMVQAIPHTRGDKGRSAVGGFYMDLANMMLANRGFYESWRLQYLSDLTTLPDYDEGYYYGRRYWAGNAPGAPVDKDGNPVFHKLPKSWDDAKTDGERWRWALSQAAKTDRGRVNQVKHHFASFLHHQFGVQTMQRYSWYFGGRGGGPTDDTKKDTSGTYELHTLGEDETIARLATGIKRFKLPKEFNFIRIFKDVADGGNSAQPAIETLCKIFENRRQYPRAAELWKQNIDRFGAGHNNYRKKCLDQIVKNWGIFEPVMTQPGGKGATVEYRFRNGRKVSLTAHEIKISKLLDDVKAYIKTKPAKFDWGRANIGNIGYRLVTKNEKQYMGRQVAQWDLDLKPLDKHFDRRITVTTPLQKAGAYLLTAKMAGGNTSRIIIWVADTAIVKKQLDKKVYYFVADAVTGQPVAKANLEFFGYQRTWKRGANSRVGTYLYNILNFAEFTDADGQCIPDPAKHKNGYSWLITATTKEGRLAYMGFSGIWYGSYYDREYNATKTFVITDRPVYRPKQKVKFKFWVNHAKYDQEGKSAFAGRKFTVRVNDPKGEKVFEKAYTADEYGGFDGELTLPEEAALGRYYVHLPNDKKVKNPARGGNYFRVEEYKKPEFEVKVEAPKEPVMLGEKVTAKIVAKYYFGAPVTEGKVKYKILRTDHSARWYPIFPWDWFYGGGYWWFACDYDWYPGWRAWGCKRPLPGWWWEWHPRKQPEVIAEVEAPLGKDGVVEVVIDTSLAKEIHGDTDHKYEITAEVTDQSRRTIVGVGKVLVARKPFKVYAWVNRGHYRVGDTVRASFKAHTLDSKPVKGTGVLRLLKISYEKDQATGRLTPVEREVRKWDLNTDVEGKAAQQVKASAAGQYRLSYKLTDSKEHTIEGGYVFVIRGEGFDGADYRFNDIELVTDKRQYAPRDKVNLMINTNRAGAAVVLFVRPANGVGLPPKVLRLKGKSITQQIEVIKKDMPNFFVEAFTVSGGKVHTETREVIVPPESRIIKVEVKPSAEKYKPGQKAKIALKITDSTGEPITGSVVVSIYDKAVEYISGGSNVKEIKEFFWKWRRQHRPRTETSLSKRSSNLTAPKEIAMAFLGVFGRSVADELGDRDLQAGEARFGLQRRARFRGGGKGGAPPAPGMMMEGIVLNAAKAVRADKAGADGLAASAAEQPTVEPTVRTKFADTAFWAGALVADGGTAEVELTMPENLTTWKARVWAMGAGTRCGEGTVEVVTTKDLIIRLQAPRFFVQKDEVVLSANVHNYLKTKKRVKVVLELEGKTLLVLSDYKIAGDPRTQTVEVEANGEKRVDWRVKVVEEGTAKITMKALTDEESDAMAMDFPVYVHGMLKTESFCGVIRPEKTAGVIDVNVPKERRPAQSRLEVRYSPTLAGAMVDALPYMVDYPYGCTEQTLNRFLPTVITQKVLLRMGLDLKDVKDKRTNLNAQEIGDDVKRQKDWQRLIKQKRWNGTKWVARNPVFDEAEVRRMVRAGLARLTSMQNSDGGWGWFSGWRQRSWPHTTAVVVHGLQIARDCDVAMVPGVLERGVKWLKTYQVEQVRRLKLPKKHRQHKRSADNLDAFVYMVLVDEKSDDAEMRKFLYRDRNNLAVYSKAMFGLALHKMGHKAERDMLIRNVEQFLVQDDENQTAWLKLPQGYWWYWYGSEYEAQGYYLKLLAAVQPKSAKASRLVKYLLNNRRHATYWNSTRDTSIIVEAFADYIKATGEDKPDMTVEILLDGKKAKEVKITGANIFSFDNKLVLTGKAVTTGKHRIELRKKGTGPLYYNAYLTNFTLEDPISRAGLEIKVNRDYYKLVRVDKTVKDSGSRGQVVDKKVEKYKRVPIKDGEMLTSGDLIEVELVIESKNDYEYILFEDMKAAGCEAVEVRSGYTGNEMGAYVEFRDERVTFFVRRLARGKHSVSYRLRAEIPGKFSALPTKASAMYAPELKANSDEMKLGIKD